MSSARKDSLESIRTTLGVPVEFVTDATIGQLKKAEAPFHPAYDRLSETHKCDYARAYFMHHYGGGYIDIKRATASWAAAFDKMLADPAIWITGYREVGPDTVAQLGPDQAELQERLRAEYKKLIGNGAYVCRPGTPFTAEWMESVHRVLDRVMDALAAHPSQGPRDYLGAPTPTGPSKYPLGWTEILGNIFHPLCLKYADHISYTLPPPLFIDYM